MYTHDIAISLPVRLVHDRFNFNPFPSSVTLRAVASSSSGGVRTNAKWPVRSASATQRHPNESRPTAGSVDRRVARFGTHGGGPM